MDTPETHAETTEDIKKAQVAGDQAEPTPGAETSPAEDQEQDKIFTHSAFVHIGPGSEECDQVDEEKFISTCKDPQHFHAWVHTPNQFQHNSIRTKAMAAKARKLRQLRDLESDSRTILDGEIEQIVYEGNRQILIEELVNKDAVRNYWQAMKEVQEEPEYEHYEEDRTRLAALKAMPAEKRDDEEFTELGNHMAKYGDQVRVVIDNIQKPLRESLEAHDTEKLAGLVTEERIQAESQSEFDDVYSQWEWFIGTCKLWLEERAGHPDERYYTDIEKLKAAPPEVISGLAEAFTELDASAGRALGNS